MGRLALVVDWPNAHVPWPCWASIWDSDIRREPDVLLIRPVSPDVNIGANVAIKTALDHGADEILMIAADQEFPPDALRRLRAHDKDVVGAMTISRQTGHPYLAARFTEQQTQEWVTPSQPLEKMDGIAIGCCLIKADVFKRIPPPWFMTVPSPDYLQMIVSNDFYFFRKCKEYGVETYLDSTMESPHHHTKILTSKSMYRAAPFLVEVHGNVRT